MAASDASFLESLKTARDAIVAAIAAGRLTVSYSIRGRMHQTEASTEALERLDKLIEKYEAKTARASSSPYRLASLKRPSGRGE